MHMIIGSEMAAALPLLLLSLLLLLLLLLSSASSSITSSSSCSSSGDHHQHVNSSGVHFVLHHPHSPFSPAAHPSSASAAAAPILSAVLDHDELRVAALYRRIGRRSNGRKSSPSIKKAPRSPSGRHGGGRASSFGTVDDAVSVPLNPGDTYGVSNYVTSVGLGTPPKSYAMVVDTGSSLTWLQCRPCRISCHDQVGDVFDPSSSSTYCPVPCAADECHGLRAATLNPSACSNSGGCIYEASYGDNSFSVGYLAKDTLSLSSGDGTGSRLVPGFTFGCGEDNEGLFGRSAGLLGMAKNKLSLFSQLGGRSFSYCLPTASSTGYLSIGTYNPSQYGYSFTSLLSSSVDTSLYFLRLVAVRVAGKPLPAASDSSLAVTPTIIDSGTVITRLPTETYDALSAAVAAVMSPAARRAEAYSILGTCFVGSAAEMEVPAVALVFEGGAEMVLPARNVVIEVEEEGKVCLAFAPSKKVAIIGNRQQQTFRVVYDVARSKVGFAAGGCM